MDKRLIHNLIWIPIVLIGLIALVMGLFWYLHPEPWLLDQLPNEKLLKTAFKNLFSAKINTHLPSYLRVIYKFFGLWLISVGLLIIAYTYVTRLGTQLARNTIQVVLFIMLIGVYYLVFTFLPSSPFLPIIYILTILFVCSFYFSNKLGE